MKVILALIQVATIIGILFYLYGIRKKKDKLVRSVRWLLGCAAVSVFLNSLFIISPSTDFAIGTFSLFTASVDWLLLFFIIFVLLYTGYGTRSVLLRIFVWFLLIKDSISMVANPILKHVFTIEQVKGVYGDYYVTVPFYLYYVHLGISYIFVVLAVYYLVKKIRESNPFYRKKYTFPLAGLCVVVVLDGLYMFMDFSYNISILFYAVVCGIISYFALSYSPSKLLSQQLMLVADEQNLGIICFDDVGKCTYTNNVAKAFLMRMPEEEQDPVAWEKKRRAAHDTEDDVHYSFMENVQWQGRTYYYEIGGRKQFYGEKEYVGMFYTISDHTEIMERHAKELEASQKAMDAKSNFLASVSHEIRTPLNAIMGMNEMILRENHSESISGYAKDIKDSAEALLHIINDVLDFSKIESGNMDLIEKPYETSHLMRSVIMMVESKAEEKGLAMHLQLSEGLPRMLIGDELRLQQIMINILSNAVKYTKKGYVRLKVDGHFLEENEYKSFLLQVDVEDTGIGVHEEDIPKLTRAYERINEAKLHYIQGTGLGLGITQKLLERMGSHLEVHSTYGKGSNFGFSVKQRVEDADGMGDIYKDREPVQDYEYKETFRAPNAKILVVDDNRFNRSVFVKLLKETQIQIDEADSGKECLKKVKDVQYDMIFLDHMMPEMNGIETFRRMKNSKKYLTKDVPVIMLTANAVSGAKELYLGEGMDDFLSKPIQMEELERMIVKYLHGKTDTDRN